VSADPGEPPFSDAAPERFRRSTRVSDRGVVRELFDAVEARDLGRVGALLADDVTWQNVPHEPAVGRAAVVEMFEWILPLCERVEWEIVTENYRMGTGWVERVDHFWIDGTQHSVACNGVFRIDRARGVITEVRDYVDVGHWWERIGPVYERALHRRPASNAHPQANGRRPGRALQQVP
jgi:limonene-1,2-epoxide hydrolase